MARQTDYKPGLLPHPAYGMTHDELAKRFGISRRRVQQLEQQALEIMAEDSVLREYFQEFLASKVQQA